MTDAIADVRVYSTKLGEPITWFVQWRVILVPDGYQYKMFQGIEAEMNAIKFAMEKAWPNYHVVHDGVRLPRPVTFSKVTFFTPREIRNMLALPNPTRICVIDYVPGWTPDWLSPKNPAGEIS